MENSIKILPEEWAWPHQPVGHGLLVLVQVHEVFVVSCCRVNPHRGDNREQETPGVTCRTNGEQLRGTSADRTFEGGALTPAWGPMCCVLLTVSGWSLSRGRVDRTSSRQYRSFFRSFFVFHINHFSSMFLGSFKILFSVLCPIN